MRVLICLLLFFAGFAQAEDFLEPDAAFKTSVRVLDPRTLQVDFDVAEGYHLYRERLSFELAARDAKLGAPALPTGQAVNDDNFGNVEIYKGHVAVRLPVQRRAGAAAEPADLTVVLQGCAEAGLCYPPQTRDYKLRLGALTGAPAESTSVLPVANAVPAPGAVPLATVELADRAVPPPAGAGDETGRIAQALQQSSLWANLFFFFLAGLGLSLTPCVFPMIPILSGIIAGQGNQVSRGRGLALSAAYVLGMALTYSAAGVAAGLSGTLISSALQNPWVLGGFAAVFVALAMSMFGFYNLQLPSALQSKLSDGAGHLQGGRGLGVFMMGALSALIVGPCVAAPLAGALLYIGQTGNAALGGAALFAMALGMGVPLLLVGMSAGALLPRAGMWMEGVKKFFGVLLLATAVWLVSPVIPAAVQMVAWALLLIVPAIYLHALDPLPANAHGWHRFWKGCGVAMLVVGSAVLLGVLSGSRDPMQPLAGLSGRALAQDDTKMAYEHVRSVAELDAKLADPGRPVMLDIYAEWCTSCKEMERFTFSDAAVRAKLAGLKLLKVDVTGNTEADKAILARFGLFGPPGVIFLDPSGQEIAGKRLVGFQDAASFLKNLDGVI